MKLHVVAVGHRMPAWVSAGYEEYARRFPRDLPLMLHEIKPEPRGSGPASEALTARMTKAEAARIQAAVPDGAVVVALDERGRTLSTHELAQRLAGWMQTGRDVAFVIGGADGLDPQIKQSAQLMLALSAMTLPHQLARILLAEQLYRANSLLHNHPYHRE